MANRVAIADGVDPLAEKRRANTPTFRAAAAAAFEAKRPRWRSARTARAWMQSLEKHAFPEAGALRVDTIAQDDILRVLKPLWSTRPQRARKLRHAPVVPGPRSRRGECGGGSHRRGVARHLDPPTNPTLRAKRSRFTTDFIGWAEPAFRSSSNERIVANHLSL